MLLRLIQTNFLLAQGNGGSGLSSMLVMMVPIFVLFYLLFLRPQQKEQSARRLMLENLKKNDRVVTVGGIIGVVTNIDRDKKVVTLRVDESTGTKLPMTLSSINRVVTDDPSKTASS